MTFLSPGEAAVALLPPQLAATTDGHVDKFVAAEVRTLRGWDFSDT